MTTIEQPATTRSVDYAQTIFDVVVIGAGLTGLNQLRQLRERNFSVRLFEAGNGVGGTWYWNRYPGARLDSESYSYAFSFDEELIAEWDWKELFVPREEVEAYLNRAADKWGVREDIELGARIRSMTFAEADNIWTIETENGITARTRFVVTAVGILSAPIFPQAPGLEDYTGECYHTGLWPSEDITFDGKRVIVIGTGSSGVQIITEIVKTAATLTVLQRTPNWCVPLNNEPIDPSKQDELKRWYPQLFEKLGESYSGLVHEFDPRSYHDVDEAERIATFERIWKAPGFAKTHAGFREVIFEEGPNETYAQFVADKIRERVHDPKVADLLIPTDHPFAPKRVPCEQGYYEVYNQGNVELISLPEHPLVRFTAAGLVVRADDGSEREIEADMIVLATGFDAYTGAFSRIDIRGVDGQTLAEAWKDGPVTYLGLQTPGFPNLLTAVGPHNKGGLCNIPRCSEQNVDWITDLLNDLRERGITRFEATPTAAKEWTSHVASLVEKTLIPRGSGYVLGANVPGKPRVFLGYIGSLPEFRDRCAEIRKNNYTGFEMS
jgi:cation diffusion facilitator CzcD-associated flavoprotein CzcO